MLRRDSFTSATLPPSCLHVHVFAFPKIRIGNNIILYGIDFSLSPRLPNYLKKCQTSQRKSSAELNISKIHDYANFDSDVGLIFKRILVKYFRHLVFIYYNK